METITLNIAPVGSRPVCHVSQYDKGRTVHINICEDAKLYIIEDGDVITFKADKIDGTPIVLEVPANAGDSFVNLTIPNELSETAGRINCELRIANGDVDIGTINFYIEVEKGVGNGETPAPARRGGLISTEVEIISTTYETT